jgi:hypothetical protein
VTPLISESVEPRPQLILAVAASPMLRQVAEGLLVRQSERLRNITIVVQG